MKLILTAGIGSFIGGASRYYLGVLWQQKNTAGFPAATLIINLAGCFLIGFLFAIAEKNNMNESWRIFLITGILGGFTTFSAFSIESIMLLKSGQLFQMSAYILASVLGGLCLSFLSYKLASLY